MEKWIDILKKEDKNIKEAKERLNTSLGYLFKLLETALSGTLPYSKYTSSLLSGGKFQLLFSTSPTLQRNKYIDSIDFSFEEFCIRLFFNRSRGEEEIAKSAEEIVKQILNCEKQ